MSVEKVREYLKEFNKENEIIILDNSSATVELAAKALNCKEEEIAKTISFIGENESCILIVCAGDKKIDSKKFKTFFGFKAKMIPFDEVEEKIGYAPGGVCPFGVNNNVKIYLDESLKRFEFIYPAAGSENSAIKMTPNELFETSKSVAWVDVVKNLF